MKKIVNLKLVLLVMAVTLCFSIGADDWIPPFIVVLNMYYFLFIANLFFIVYEKENFMTRIFLGMTKAPLYVAMATMVIVIIFLRRLYPEMNVDSAYLSAVAGIVAYTIGRIKRREVLVRP